MLGNKEWFNIYGHCKIEVLEASISYHNPVRIHLECPSQQRRSLLKFQNCIIEDENYMTI